MKIAIIGCGDVGRCYADALSASGHTVAHVCDSRPNPAIETYAAGKGVTLHVEPGPWLADVELVISAVFGGVALDVVRKSLPFMGQGAIYADFTTGSAVDLRAAGQLAAEAGVQFADVAITGAIGIGGARTPLLCAGAAAQQVFEIMSALGAPIRIVDGEAGDAVSLKLLRSVFTKGMEALAVECLMAAEQRGLRHELYEVLSDLDRSTMRDFMEVVVTTHVRHAGRRLAEVREASLQLQSEGVQPLALKGVMDLFQRSADAINKSPLEGEPTIENSLAWLYDGQRKAAAASDTET